MSHKHKDQSKLRLNKGALTGLHSKDGPDLKEGKAEYAKLQLGIVLTIAQFARREILNRSCVIVGVQATAARMSQETVAAQNMIARFAAQQGREPTSERFTYLPESNSYRCPAGQPLNYGGRNARNRTYAYIGTRKRCGIEYRGSSGLGLGHSNSDRVQTRTQARGACFLQ